MVLLSGSPVKNINVDINAYTMKRFSDDVVFYWRILKDSQELEGVLMANSTTWVAIGWRPSDLGPSCRSFPLIAERSEPLPQPEPKLESIADIEHKSTAKPEPEPVVEPEPEPEPESEPEPGVEGEKSIAKRRSAKADAATFGATSRPDVDVTVQTSVTYQVSTKQGRTYWLLYCIDISRKRRLLMFLLDCVQSIANSFNKHARKKLCFLLCIVNIQ